MQIDILTLFPKTFDSVLSESIIKRAIAKGKLKVNIFNLRDWTFDNHRSADDKPFGGGPGMVMKVEPVHLGLKGLGALATKGKRVKGKGSRLPAQKTHADGQVRVILLTPQGKKLNQALVKKIAKEKRLVLICGHYEGVDERIRNFVDEELSIGDYILTCGEIPAMVIIDSVARLLPGVLGDDESVKTESFENNFLEYPQYTRPADFMGMKVPEILLSGDHKKIEAWRKEEALTRTKVRRPDLLKKEQKNGKIL